jgi:hypothetical protein
MIRLVFTTQSEINYLIQELSKTDPTVLGLYNATEKSGEIHFEDEIVLTKYMKLRHEK